jgi:hypothetical protein
VLCKGTILKWIIFSRLKAEKDNLEKHFRELFEHILYVRFCSCCRYTFKFDGNTCVFVAGLSFHHLSMNAVSNCDVPEIL